MNLFLIAATIHAQKGLMTGSFVQKGNDSLRHLSLRSLPVDIYTKNLAFFCKQELQLEKITRISMKFRLGNIEYVDKLEGKGRYQPSAYFH